MCGWYQAPCCNPLFLQTQQPTVPHSSCWTPFLHISWWIWVAVDKRKLAWRTLMHVLITYILPLCSCETVSEGRSSLRVRMRQFVLLQMLLQHVCRFSVVTAIRSPRLFWYLTDCTSWKGAAGIFVGLLIVLSSCLIISGRDQLGRIPGDIMYAGHENKRLLASGPRGNEPAFSWLSSSVAENCYFLPFTGTLEKAVSPHWLFISAPFVSIVGGCHTVSSCTVFLQ